MKAEGATPSLATRPTKTLDVVHDSVDLNLGGHLRGQLLPFLRRDQDWPWALLGLQQLRSDVRAPRSRVGEHVHRQFPLVRGNKYLHRPLLGR